ncbi:hypothetical protein [Hymenobacter jeollabukensis]|uniref:Uncharacterized protein n=1 Tax=Hymenobacter jeollabukensis TaxID=2025313 RepID=A0A5R8WNN5_9BACT|nr:hypothetical protein [Hymenobacter jeollabukensis]TLM91687.1 hypothetical protein FDY95_14080 [Hymenobacter jeollabukensis]
MAIFDNIAKAAKDFFVESDDAAAPSTPQARPLPGAAPVAPAFAPAAPLAPQGPAAAGAAFSPPAPAVTQPEQRHTDHINGLLAGDGKDFAAYCKMVRSMAASGLSGPVLYQTAFHAFAAVTGLSVPELLASADQFERTLQSDRNKVLERHKEKLGEIKIPNTRPSVIVQLLAQEQKLQADLAELTRQLESKSQELQAAQQQLGEERQKAQAALASYELANASAAADLHAHFQAAQSFLLTLPVK